MKQRDELSTTTWRDVASQRPRHPTGRRATLLQVHPVPVSRSEILSVAIHFLIDSATTQGKATPGFSEDAATFLTCRRWDAKDLASRVARAVTSNQGSLITADDLES